jgi:hypothetical protein
VLPPTQQNFITADSSQPKKPDANIEKNRETLTTEFFNLEFLTDKILKFKNKDFFIEHDSGEIKTLINTAHMEKAKFLKLITLFNEFIKIGHQCVYDIFQNSKKVVELVNEGAKPTGLFKSHKEYLEGNAKNVRKVSIKKHPFCPAYSKSNENLLDSLGIGGVADDAGKKFGNKFNRTISNFMSGTPISGLGVGEGGFDGMPNFKFLKGQFSAGRLHEVKDLFSSILVRND